MTTKVKFLPKTHPITSRQVPSNQWLGSYGEGEQAGLGGEL